MKNKDGAAILGYDAVGYFTDHKPVKGRARFQSDYGDAKHLFASAEHKALFDAAPAKYAPAYGGYCGYAASIDRLSPISPKWFQIINGRLILQHNKKAYDKFNADLNGNLVKADRNWPHLVEREATRKTAGSRFPLTWPGYYDYGRPANPSPQAPGGTVASDSVRLELAPMPGDLSRPGF